MKFLNQHFRVHYLVFLTAVLVLAACSSGEKSEPEIETGLEDSLYITYLGIENSPEWKSITAGARETAVGHPLVVLEFLLPEPPNKLRSQKNLAGALSGTQTAGLILQAIDEVALFEPVKNLKAHNIPTITLEKPIQENLQISLASHDQELLGAMAAQIMARELGGSGDVIILAPPDTLRNGTQRIAGFKKMLTDSFPQINLLEPAVYSKSHLDSAFFVAENLLLLNPQVRGIFCPQSLGGLAMLRALREIDMAGAKILVAAGFHEQFEYALAEGELTAAVLEDNYNLGATALNVFVANSLGDSIATSRKIPPVVVNRENIHDPGIQKNLAGFLE